MFEINVAGLAELEGGKPPHRLAFEPVANVFDEFRGYEEGRKRPSFCAVTLRHSNNPRGVWLTVADDGAGFKEEKDIWTLFGTTAKRKEAGVSGRFNAGDKQLIALAREATVKTNSLTVIFAGGKRETTRHRSPIVAGTIIEALMPWSLQDLSQVRENLLSVIPPEGLAYSVDGQVVSRATAKANVRVTLPTVLLADGVLRPTTRKTTVAVVAPGGGGGIGPMLCELGLPICSLEEIEFPWTLDVGQKIPVPLSRDSVQPSYLYRLIGSVVEQAALDGIKLLSEEQQGAGFVKQALEWVKDAAALKTTVTSLFGENAVRQSSDPLANVQATAAGATIVSGRWFTPETRRRLDEGRVLPTSKEVYGGTPAGPMDGGAGAGQGQQTCPRCGGSGVV